MILWHAIVLGILQGLTEFFPISSSAHLELIPWMAGWDDFNGDASLKNGFDVALHLGTLAGAVAYFRHDIRSYVTAGVMLAGRQIAKRATPPAELQQQDRTGTDQTEQDRTGADQTEQGRTAWLLAASAIPAALAGGLLAGWLESVGDTLWLIIAMLVVFGALLWWADRRTASQPAQPADPTADPAASQKPFTAATATAMGLAQVLALLPGVSRSGVTITAGLLARLPRQQATRLSFLMGLPIIAGAGLYKFIDLGGWSGIPAAYHAGFVWGVAASAASAWLAIWGLMRLLQRATFAVFVGERMLLAAAAAALLLAGVR